MRLVSPFTHPCRTGGDFSELPQAGSQITSILAYISAAGLVIASAGLGATFAFSTGSEHGMPLACLLTTFAIALELAEPVAVSAAFTAFWSLAFMRGLALSLLATVAIAYSLTAELTLMATARGDVAAQRAADTRAARSMDGRRDRIEAELTKLASVRPAATIKAEIAGLLADPRLGDCHAMRTRRARVECPKVSVLRAELGNAERRDKLEGELASLQSGTPGAMLVAKEAAPGAHALSIYLAAAGVVVPAAKLAQWLTLVPVLALELGAALSVLLVQSVSGGHRGAPSMRSVPVALPTEPVDGQTPASAPRTPTAGRPVVGSKSRPWRPPTRTPVDRASTRSIGHATVATKAGAQSAIVDTLKSQGGRIESASVRGLAALIGAHKSNVHNALAALIKTGTVAKVGRELTLT